MRRTQQYVPRTLREELRRRGRLPAQECLALALSLAEPVEYLHRAGLVHRDIKPSNIIFVKGVLKLADIGLVAELDEAKSFVGTLGFIPPEGPGTPQADVYGLGKVLYEMLSGKDRHAFPDDGEGLRNGVDDRLLAEGRDQNRPKTSTCSSATPPPVLSKPGYSSSRAGGS